MYKFGYVNAGTNEFHKWGRKAQEKLAKCAEPNENGFICVPADGGKYWTFGTSDGKYGEFAKYQDTFFSVNKAGKIWAKVGTEKAAKLVEMINGMVAAMKAESKRGIVEEEDED